MVMSPRFLKASADASRTPVAGRLLATVRSKAMDTSGRVVPSTISLPEPLPRRVGVGSHSRRCARTECLPRRANILARGDPLGEHMPRVEIRVYALVFARPREVDASRGEGVRGSVLAG